MKYYKIIIIFSTIILVITNISAQTGGNFSITQSVVAGGGGQQTTGDAFSVDGTTGQSLAGDNSTSGAFGYFKFDDVAVGETYIFTVFAKRFTFTQPTIIRSVFNEIADLDFIADEQ